MPKPTRSLKIERHLETQPSKKRVRCTIIFHTDSLASKFLPVTSKSEKAGRVARLFRPCPAPQPIGVSTTSATVIPASPASVAICWPFSVTTVASASSSKLTSISGMAGAPVSGSVTG